MNEDEARIIRIYQYLLSKDVYLKNNIVHNERYAIRKNPDADDVFDLWYSLIKLEIWKEIAGELWNLLK